MLFRSVRRDAFKYVEWSEAVYQRFWPNRGLLAVHVAGAGVALLIGPLQFVPIIRTRWPKFHRSIGWIYVIACLGTIPSSLRLSLDSGCALCVSAFVVWSSVAFIVTAIAAALAILGRYRAHRDFMIRSYVLMYAFVFVRLDNHLLDTPFEIPLADDVPRNSMVIWLAWVVPLMMAELFLVWIPTLQKALRSKRHRPATSG